MSLATLDMDRPGSWTTDEAFDYVMRLGSVLDRLDPTEVDWKVLDRLRAHRDESLWSIWKYRTVDFSPMFVACVAHRYEPDVSPEVKTAMQTMRVLNDDGEYYSWSLHS